MKRTARAEVPTRRFRATSIASEYAAQLLWNGWVPASARSPLVLKTIQYW